jgi:hypothetical protein
MESESIKVSGASSLRLGTPHRRTWKVGSAPSPGRAARDDNKTASTKPPPHLFSPLTHARRHPNYSLYTPSTHPRAASCQITPLPPPPPWFTKCSSGADSVNPSPPRITTAASRDRHTNAGTQASACDYGSLASKCARSSTKNPSGSTPSTPPLAAASDTGSWASSTDSTRCCLTAGTHCWRSGPGGRSAKRPRWSRNHERTRHRIRHMHAHRRIEKKEKTMNWSFAYCNACERAIADLDLASAIFNCDASGGRRGVRGQESEGAF